MFSTSYPRTSNNHLIIDVIRERDLVEVDRAVLNENVETEIATDTRNPDSDNGKILANCKIRHRLC